MNNTQVAHLWANHSRANARGSHFYFEGDTIYSYGSHFPIARHYKGAVLFTTKGYSVTTAQHKSYVRQACSHLEVYEVSSVMDDPSGKDVREHGERIKSLALSAGRARNPDNALRILEGAVNEANSFCARFGFKTRFSMPGNIGELRERARASAKRERKAKAAREAQFEKDCAVIVVQWLAGEKVSIPYQYSKTLLRSRRYQFEEGREPEAVMETSKGAIVPLAEAQKAFRFACLMRERGWRRNGETFQIGDYQLDAINEQGVIAGCHRVTWDEIDRFARAQGWTA